MNKLIMVLLIAAAAVFSADARYVRKLKEPDFFIPEQDKMHKPEKLPKIVVLKPKAKVKEEKFTKVPEYKNKYNKYIASLAVFTNTKTIPENKELTDDLAKMETGEVFEITEEVSQEITTKEQKEFYTLAAKILND